MSKVTVVSRPTKVVVASKGVQGIPGPEGPRGLQGLKGDKGDTGDVTPAALAARDAAQLAATDAAGSATLAGAAASMTGDVFGVDVAVPFAAGLNVNSTRFTVSHGGFVYAPVSVPFTTTGTFNPAQWRLIQGVTGADLATATGAGMVGFRQAGSGAATRSLQSKLRDVVSIADFGAVLDGVTDDTAAYQAAANYAKSNGFRGIYHPDGTAVVSATVDLGRLQLRGNGDGSRINPTISDGSAVLSFSAGTNFFSVQGIRIDNGLPLGSFVSGAINAQNCTGIRIISSGGTHCARFMMRDVFVRGCKIGYDINGFIGTLDNVWALACETGFIATQLNSTRLHLRFEECRKDFAITASKSIHFDQLLAEGGMLQSGLESSTIDGCNGVTLTAPYLEQARNQPFVIFGGTTECRAVTINGLSIGSADTPGSNYDTFMLAFDKVNGLDVSGFFSTGAHHSFYSVTPNTKNIIDNSIPNSSSVWGPHDNSKNLSVVRNYFPNPNFDLWFRGWPAVSVVRAVASAESAIVRRGQRAVRLTLNAGQANGSIAWAFNDNYLAVQLRGKQISLYMWVWIPNTPDFDPNALGAQPVQVYTTIYTDGTGGGTATSGTHHTVRGAWNLMKITANVPADCARLDATIFMAMSSGTSSGTEYIVIDSVFIVEGSGQDVAIRNGWISDSALNPCHGAGGLARIRGTAIPTDVDQTYVAGDTIENAAPVAGSPLGWVCVAGGSPGTWQPFGQAGALTSIASAPAFIGQMAVTGGQAYIATGTSSAANWKQATV